MYKGILVVSDEGTLLGDQETVLTLVEKGVKVCVSSTDTCKRVVNQLKRSRIGVDVTPILASRAGSRRQHTALLRSRFPEHKIVFVLGPGPDMGLGDGTIALVPNPGEAVKAIDKGAVKTIHSFSEILNLDLGAI